MSSSYRSNRSGLSHWDPYAVCRGGCPELYYCNMVEWFWWDSSLISTTNWFPSMLYLTLALVTWPVEILPEMTYYVLRGTFGLYTDTAAALQQVYDMHSHSLPVSILNCLRLELSTVHNLSPPSYHAITPSFSYHE